MKHRVYRIEKYPVHGICIMYDTLDSITKKTKTSPDFAVINCIPNMQLANAIIEALNQEIRGFMLDNNIEEKS